MAGPINAAVRVLSAPLLACVEFVSDARYNRVHSRLLADSGEQLEAVVPKHPVAYIKPGLIALLGPLVWLLMIPVEQLSARAMLFVLGFVPIVWSGVLVVERALDVFVITSARVFRTSGLLTTRRATMPITRILDITVEQPFLGRVVGWWGRRLQAVLRRVGVPDELCDRLGGGYGHFIFESAAQEQGLREIRFISHPDARERRIQELIVRRGG